jgi:hypothetical protein
VGQPLPKPGQAPVTSEAILSLTETIVGQSAKGQQKYGRELETFNGRDAGQDALEELADLAVYLTQMRLERAEVDRQLAMLHKDLAEAVTNQGRLQARLAIAEREVYDLRAQIASPKGVPR